MVLSYNFLFNPATAGETPLPTDEEHMKNWLMNREYEYYQKHKFYVDKYGVPTASMKMTKDEHNKLLEILHTQNEERFAIVEDWQQHNNDIIVEL